MKETTEEKLERLQIALVRLVNHNRDIDTRLSELEEYAKEKHIPELYSKLFDISSKIPKKEFEIGRCYVDTIKEIISVSDLIEFSNKNFYKYELILESAPEIHNAFILSTLKIQKGARIKFEYQEGFNLKKVKIY
jgi:hypothetical protein